MEATDNLPCLESAPISGAPLPPKRPWVHACMSGPTSPPSSEGVSQTLASCGQDTASFSGATVDLGLQIAARDPAGYQTGEPGAPAGILLSPLVAAIPQEHTGGLDSAMILACYPDSDLDFYLELELKMRERVVRRLTQELALRRYLRSMQQQQAEAEEQRFLQELPQQQQPQGNGLAALEEECTLGQCYPSTQQQQQQHEQQRQEQRLQKQQHRHQQRQRTCPGAACSLSPALPQLQLAQGQGCPKRKLPEMQAERPSQATHRKLLEKSEAIFGALEARSKLLGNTLGAELSLGSAESELRRLRLIQNKLWDLECLQTQNFWESDVAVADSRPGEIGAASLSSFCGDSRQKRSRREMDD